MASFQLVPETIDFPGDEEKTLAYWKQIDAFKTSLKKSEGKPEFTFYDGPPFATGLPHYGHILAGTIKDTVTRYAHQTGHHVSRRFGWDCHGLPVEFEIDKKLGIKGKDDVAKMGIARYNAECRAIVQRYSKEWEDTVTRMGRWIDFKNDYKTLDTSFMESVWWVFSQMHQKGLVYQGFKVMPFSTACTTVVSNFESRQNMKDVQDPAVVVSFPVLPDKSYSMLAWTTTPWTLPSNLGLCVNPDMDYVKIKEVATGKQYVLAKCRLFMLYPAKKGKKAAPKQKQEKKEEPHNRFKKEKNEDADEPVDESAFEILEEMKGSALAGLKYEPLFEYFVGREDTKGAWIVMADDYVTDSSGTGVVHQAPAFGEDDYRVCLKHNVIVRGAGIICPVDDSGNFMDDVTDFKGRYVKEADRDIIRLLTKRGRLVQDKQITHAYPHCWRSDSPLLYRAVPSWYINVPAIKDKLLANNLKTYWVPETIQTKKFHNWLKDACDWSVSRSRYWGTPIPIWMSDDGEEMVVIGSIEQLRTLSGEKDITDLHRDKIDHITIPSQKGKGVLRRVPEVFDCWFESGSMPYAQVHYPFENKEKFENGFPADFIAEGVDQTRGWFYTLMVISTALFDKPPFKNLIVNGLVLASDKKKMSKRLKNYPDPRKVVNENGADALRLYLINSPVVRADELAFNEDGVRSVVGDIFIPWYHAYRLFIACARGWQQSTGKTFKPDANIHKKTNNQMDQWILSYLQSLVRNVRLEMSKYFLYTVIPFLLKFVDSLSKWYLRFNKLRLKGETSPEDCQLALQTLFKVLFETCKLMGPFTPFLVENMYQNLKCCLPKQEQEDSVHYLMIPEVEEDAIKPAIERGVATMQTIVELGWTARTAAKISMRVPLSSLTVINSDPKVLAECKVLSEYIKDQLRVRELVFQGEDSTFVQLKLKPDNKALGSRLNKQVGSVLKALRGLSQSDIKKFQTEGKFDVPIGSDTVTVTLDECSIEREFCGDTKKFQSQAAGATLLVFSKTVDSDCKAEGMCREVMSNVQQLRKKAGLNAEEKVSAWYKCEDDKSELAKALISKAELISSGLSSGLEPMSQRKGEEIISEVAKISLANDAAVTISITRS
mmetsp:Transcript_28893/g.40602  ORF Transcript_28893/g.40602 Transcript_28893/m.40602 type:complete len:1110 (-) Transcript_28893:233-3562(-)|eukprot:CAMPEP_0175100658 /NCGR_PEP_ID=MMETSP0086_2-20121207/7262_1 /TAXON_ID=136419 /ORGANISM="Unknown Unknown, Strain D1" /LENGTH=1109 /DNA_ID=CAMNT_0016374899 /DNA_START=39 /DNA_END=3368 /DNA_ORIENTATION=+